MTSRSILLAIPIAALLLLAILAQSSNAQAPAAKAPPPEPEYARLDEIPASAGVRLPCRKSEGDECATRVRLRRNTMVWGLPLRAGTVATDWEEDRSGTLARDFEYKGVWLKRGTRISLYTTWTGTLLRDQTFGGIPCRGGTEATFRDGGQLDACTLAAPATIDGHRYEAGTRLAFDENGHVTSPVF